MADATSGAAPGVKTLVRGPDGTLYLLSANKPPLQLKEKEAAKVDGLLEEAEKRLTKLLVEMPATEMSCTHNIHIQLPEVFTP